MLIVILVLSFLLLLLDSIGVVKGIYSLTSLVSVPVRLELHKLSYKVNDLLGVFAQISDFKKDNEELRVKNQELIEQLSELDELRSENDSLKQELGLEIEKEDWMVEGRVISYDLSHENVLQINVGTDDGVREGDVVIYGKYAIGIVKKADSHFSKVFLITSRASNIPVRGQKNRAVGLIQGDVGLTLNMIDILPDEKIEEGELIVTSGVNSNYPSDLIIGIVSEVDSNPANTTQEAHVEIQLDFSKLDYIFVIRGQQE